MKLFNVLLAIGVVVVLGSCGSGTSQHGNNDSPKIKQHDGHGHAHESHAHEGHGHKGDGKAHWSYEGEDGPDKWSDLCPAYSPCAGNHQSPIDLSTSIGEENEVEFSRNYQCHSGLEFINNGHSVQVNFNDGKKSTITVNNEVFELKQFHFHCPSEHTLNGEPFDSEVHLVHVSEEGNISVIGVFIKEGANNDFLAGILPNLPKNSGDKTNVEHEVCPVDWYADDQKFYIYEGSLTTPPCSEGVNWFVSRVYAEASAEQIAALAEAMPKNNARPVQALNERGFGKLDE